MDNKLKIKNASDRDVIWRNFAGAERDFNDEGDRNFNLVIKADLAEQLKEEGWNVKVRPPRMEGAEPTYHLPVKVKFGKYPPKVNLVTKNGVDHKGNTIYNVNELDEETVKLVDITEFECIDLMISPYNWTNRRGESGITAYLDEFWGVVKENEFASKYSNRGNNPEDMLPFGMLDK